MKMGVEMGVGLKDKEQASLNIRHPDSNSAMPSHGTASEAALTAEADQDGEIWAPWVQIPSWANPPGGNPSWTNCQSHGDRDVTRYELESRRLETEGMRRSSLREQEGGEFCPQASNLIKAGHNALPPSPDWSSLDGGREVSFSWRAVSHLDNLLIFDIPEAELEIDGDKRLVIVKWR